MFGFGQKKPSTPEPEAQGRVQTIPDIFYGGNDPEVYRREVATTVVSAPRVVVDNPKQTVSTTSVAVSTSHRGLWWGAAGFVFLGVVSGIVWYYTQGIRTKPVAVVTIPTTTVAIEIVPTSTEEILTTTSTAVEVTNNTIALPTSSVVVGGPLEFPVINPLNTVDFDKDVLTDAEEEIFGTDPAAWDTESDGYYDGQEVFNLYNPIGMAPVRLIDSGTVLEYISPVFGYSFYYPKNWVTAPVDNAGRQVIVTAPNGDYFEVRALPKESAEDFNAWFARNIKDQNITDLLQATNRFEVQGWKRRDDLVAYFMGQSEGFVVIYHPLSSGPINFRHIAQMVAQSFRPGRINPALPDQPILPGTAAAVSSTVTTSTL